MAEGGEAPEFECPICFDTIPSSEAASLCGKGHRFCPDCCWRCCQSALSDGLVPACPHDKEARCGTIPKQAASAALSRWLCQKGEQQTRKAELQAAGWSIRGSKAAGFTSGKLDEVYLSAERARQGAVQCIGKRCKEWLVPPIPHSPLAQRLVCSSAKCGASFCAACRHPYHFRSTCAEALRINARWVRFLQTEMGAFLMAAVRVEPERYGATLKAYVKSKSALDEATRDALQRFEELKKMELWKEKHCRHCPNCKRVVEKLRRHALSPNLHPHPNPNPNPHPSSKILAASLTSSRAPSLTPSPSLASGCDHMVCGSDAHAGGNEQRGCGRAFSWAAAPRYEADLRSAAADGGGGAAEGEGEAGRERRLQRDAREEHLLMPGVPVQCDGCGEAIVGPRLQCVQCEGAVELCIGCVGKAAHGKALPLRDGRLHPKQHVFRRVRQLPLEGGARVLELGAEGELVELAAGSGGGSGGVPACGAAPSSAGARRGAVGGAVDLTGGGGGGGSSGGGGGSSRKRPMGAAHHGGIPGAIDLTAPPSSSKRAGRGEQRGGAASTIELSSDEDEAQLQAGIRASLGESKGQAIVLD